MGIHVGRSRGTSKNYNLCDSVFSTQNFVYSKFQETKLSKTEVSLKDERGGNTIHADTLINYLSPQCHWVYGVQERIAEVN